MKKETFFTELAIVFASVAFGHWIANIDAGFFCFFLLNIWVYGGEN